MTRLSEALQRAAAEAAAAPAPDDTVSTPDPQSPSAAEWHFAPVETMHVPEEPPSAPGELRTAGADAIIAAGATSSDGQARAAAPPPSTEQPAVKTERPRGASNIKRTLGGADHHKLIIGESVEAATIEQYRHLGAVMHHAQKASNVRSIMVTSALPAEGKTLTATNLALTLSESYQRRVLLIDADLRRPRMREMFELPVTEGLTDSLAMPREGRLPVHQITPTLWVLTSGRVLPDPMSLLVSPAMKQLLDDAKDSFDWVVVDTPPIGLLSDANLLASMIDTTLLVVSAKSTPYPMVQRAAEAVGTNRILGVVLNRADSSSASGYGMYGNYGTKHYQPGHPTPERRRWFGWLRNRGGVPHVQ
jgi:receptor protein-tyrosine kinase